MTVQIDGQEGTERAMLLAVQEAVTAVEMARQRRDLLRKTMDATGIGDRRHTSAGAAQEYEACRCRACGCQVKLYWRCCE